MTNQIDKEQARWQEAIRNEVQKHNPSAEIDGGGCDSGDALDLSLAEIAQGFNNYQNRANDALEQLGLLAAIGARETSLDAVIRLFTSDSWEPDVEAMSATIVSLREKVTKPIIPRDDVIWFILGRPCFVLAPVAHRLRALGHDIKTKCEDEQAYVMHWLLNLYFKHGTTWKDEMNRVLKAEQNNSVQHQAKPV